METFIKIKSNLLSRKDLTATQKIIISYVESYQVNGNILYETMSEISEKLGMSLPTLKRNVKNLIKLDIIKHIKICNITKDAYAKSILDKSKNPKPVKRQYKNRKALILNEMSDSNEVIEENNTPTPKTEVKPVEVIKTTPEVPVIEETKKETDMSEWVNDFLGDTSYDTEDEVFVEDVVITNQRIKIVKNKIDLSVVLPLLGIKDVEGYRREHFNSSIIKDESSLILQLNFEDIMNNSNLVEKYNNIEKFKGTHW